MTFWGKIIGNLTSNPCLEKEHFFWDTLKETDNYGLAILKIESNL